MLTASEIEGALTEIFRDVFMRDELVLSSKLTAHDVEGWDSMKQIDILIATENHFRIKFNTREIDALQSVGDLLALISRKLQ